ncbi:MAG: hypothetical protein SNG27_04640 [Rikenellaceae bacterium]
MKNFIATIVSIFCLSGLFAQPHMNASIQNMHLWRGGEVADGIVVTTELFYTDSHEHWKVGFWGGTNSTGDYKEFNYTASYTTNNLQIALSDTYNFSTYATYNYEEFFNYIPSETGRFLDLTINYSIGKKNPLTLKWATVLFGRDRDAENRSNRYSTFCSAEYPIYKNGDWKVDAGVGAAFALKNIDNSANFYGDKAGIVEATLKVSNVIKINNYEMPIYMLMMWNPQADEAHMQLCIQVINF